MKTTDEAAEELQPTQEFSMFCSEPDTIVLWGARGGMYFPVQTWNVAALKAKGYDGQFAIGYIGQAPQLVVEPSGCDSTMLQVDSPVQDLNSNIGGNPARLIVTEPMNVTVFFATGHTKVLAESGMEP